MYLNLILYFEKLVNLHCIPTSPLSQMTSNVSQPSVISIRTILESANTDKPILLSSSSDNNSLVITTIRIPE